MLMVRDNVYTYSAVYSEKRELPAVMVLDLDPKMCSSEVQKGLVLYITVFSKVQYSLMQSSKHQSSKLQ